MPMYQEQQRESTSKPAKPSTKQLLPELAALVGAGVLVVLIYASVVTLQGGYANVEEAVASPPSGENAALPNHDTQASR